MDFPINSMVDLSMAMLNNQMGSTMFTQVFINPINYRYITIYHQQKP